jgi:hypothetical protein
VADLMDGVDIARSLAIEKRTVGRQSVSKEMEFPIIILILRIQQQQVLNMENRLALVQVDMEEMEEGRRDQNEQNK